MIGIISRPTCEGEKVDFINKCVTEENVKKYGIE